MVTDDVEEYEMTEHDQGETSANVNMNEIPIKEERPKKFTFRPFNYEDVQKVILPGKEASSTGEKGKESKERSSNASAEAEEFRYEGFELAEKTERRTEGVPETDPRTDPETDPKTKGNRSRSQSPQNLIYGVVNEKKSSSFIGHKEYGIFYDHDEFGRRLLSALSLGFLLTKETLLEMWAGESKPRVSSTTLTFHRPSHHCDLRRVSDHFLQRY